MQASASSMCLTRVISRVKTRTKCNTNSSGGFTYERNINVVQHCSVRFIDINLFYGIHVRALINNFTAEPQLQNITTLTYYLR